MLNPKFKFEKQFRYISHIQTEENRATSKVTIFWTFIQKINKKQLNYLETCSKLIMHFFQLDRKVTNQILLRKKEMTFNCYEISLANRSWGTRYFSMRMEKWQYFISSSSSTQSSSIGFAGCMWCYIRRTHWPAIRNWRFYQTVLLLVCLIAPTIFRGGVHDSLMPSLHLCMHVCAVNAGGCVIDLLSRAGLPPALYCAWSQETIQPQIIRPSPPVPYVYPCIWHGGWETGDKNYLRHSHTISGDPSRQGIEPGSSVWKGGVFPLDNSVSEFWLVRTTFNETGKISTSMLQY